MDSEQCPVHVRDECRADERFFEPATHFPDVQNEKEHNEAEGREHRRSVFLNLATFDEPPASN